VSGHHPTWVIQFGVLGRGRAARPTARGQRVDRGDWRLPVALAGAVDGPLADRLTVAGGHA
jgi:hypothetical protein